MKIGCCVSLWEDLIFHLPQAGCQYAEGGFSSLADKSLDQVRTRAAQLEKAGVRLETMNVLFPGDFHLTGPQADFAAVDNYLEENLPKAQALGVSMVVFGSGGARRVPEGFPQEGAFAWEGEPLSALESYRGRLGHCHIASAQNSRLLPQPWDGQDYLPFFQTLAAMGYEGRLSLEGDTRGGLSQIRSSLEYLQALASQAAPAACPR